MIEDRDAEKTPSGLRVVRRADVVLARRGVAGGVLVRERDGGSVDPHRRAEDLANANQDVEEHYWREFPRFRGDITSEQLRTIIDGLRRVGRVAAAVDLLAMSLPKEPDANLAELAAAVLEEFLEKAAGDREAAGLQSYDFTRLFEYSTFHLGLIERELRGWSGPIFRL